MAKVTLKKTHTHSYAKLRLVKDDEEPTISVIHPDGQREVDMLRLQLRQLDEREAASGQKQDAERQQLQSSLDATMKKHKQDFMTARQWVVAYASDDNRYSLAIEVSRTEMESAAVEITIDVG